MKFADWWQKYVAASGGGDCQLSNVAAVMAVPEPWMSEQIEEFIARAEALLDNLSKEGGQAAPSAELVTTSDAADQALHLVFSAQILLATAGKKPEDWPSIPIIGNDPEKGSYISWSSTLPTPAELLADGGESLHAIWLATGREAGLKHPVAALIDAWLSRPVSFDSDTHPTQWIGLQGLMDKQPLTLPAQLRTVEADALPALGRGSKIEDGQLPFTFGGDTILQFTPLVLAEAVGMRQALRGRGARIDKRLLLYSLLSIPRERRYPGARHEWRPPLREIRDLIWRPTSSGKSSYRPSVHGDDLLNALRAVTLAEIILEDGYMWRPVMVRGNPAMDDLDSTAIIEIELPDGCNHGPAIDKPELIEAGMISDPVFDLEIGLAYLWDETKRRNGGYRIYARRPEVLRNDQGHIVGNGGQLILERGDPVTNWQHPQAVRTGKTERHPQADRVPVLTPAERHRLAYGVRRGDKDKGQLSRERKTVDRRLQLMELAGRITIEKDVVDPKTGGQGWRILERWKTR